MPVTSPAKKSTSRTKQGSARGWTGPLICGSPPPLQPYLRTFPSMNTQVVQIRGPNPGHRAAADPRTGAVYTLYGNPISPCATPELLGGIKLEYRLNRSTDGGR